MQNKKLKNTIVLKGMASNIVEEAIVILKPNIKLKQREFVDKNSVIQKRNIPNDYIVREAEKVILNYVQVIENENRINRKLKRLKKFKFLQLTNIVLVIMLIIMIIM